MSGTSTSPKEISIERFYSVKVGDAFFGLVPAPSPLSRSQLRELRARINQELYEEKGDDTESILAAVCDHFRIGRGALFHLNRSARSVWPRQLAMFLLYETGNFSLNEIGVLFKKNHGTVLHSITAVKNRREIDSKSARDLASIRKLLSTQTQNGDEKKDAA